ncbi:MAG: hypothetical protein GWM93_18380, partial [Gemmatimonadetes bacterium]|nr:hypothetical protein [Gemmatimonadota bacterium]NIT68621.1 hypothetical protein [Gemmatimonadota bacterium]NIW77337.1 hypothetical protein [Gemmatimonadota bacterium]NIY37198.1 hypothetical protein [Gemmatimonadota bacterium]
AVPIPRDLYDYALRERTAIVFDFQEPNPLLPRDLQEMVSAESGIAIPLISEDQ